VDGPVPIDGVVQHYAWGDRSFLPQLLHRTADGRPWAELWLGTHPSGPATIAGEPLAERTGELPYLLKVLAAAEPLSLQAHPNREQALDGRARGIYPDDRAKPELLCALTRFDALCGIRPTAATVTLLDVLGAGPLAAEIRSHGVGAVIEGLYRGRIDPRPTVIACAGSQRPEAELVTRLTARYPDDPSVVVTLLLNRVTLQPGEAIHLTAGNLHAYLSGAGVELMGASDNVVRGGLTVKPVDVDELLRILDTKPLAEPAMKAAVQSGRYPLPEAGCSLVRVEPGRTHISTGHELAIGLDGRTLYLPPGSSLTPTARTFVATTT
jgi:mannose-6-phosphate isomerase